MCANFVKYLFYLLCLKKTHQVVVKLQFEVKIYLEFHNNPIINLKFNVQGLTQSSLTLLIFFRSTIALQQICNCWFGRITWALTHCWPHDKRGLVNKSNGEQERAAVCPVVPLSRCPLSHCPWSCFLLYGLESCSVFEQKVLVTMSESFCFCLEVATSRLSAFGPLAQVASRRQHATWLAAALSTGYSYFICLVDLWSGQANKLPLASCPSMFIFNLILITWAYEVSKYVELWGLWGA